MLGNFLFLAAAGLLSAKGPQPVLELPKTSFALGEQVFFWTGVTAVEPLDRGLYQDQPCQVEITDPDSRTTASPISWPMDGDPSHGWRGGNGIPGEAALPGTYRVRVSCGSSAVVGRFDVLGVPELSKIDTGFDLSNGCKHDPYDYTITLWLRNNSSLQLQVASPGALMANYVSFAARRPEPPAECDGFFPPEAMGVRSPAVGDVVTDNLSYARLSVVGHWQVAPNEDRRWTFCASSGLSTCPASMHLTLLDVFATLEILLGPPSSPEGQQGPYRLPVFGHFVLRDK